MSTQMFVSSAIVLTALAGTHIGEACSNAIEWAEESRVSSLDIILVAFNGIYLPVGRGVTADDLARQYAVFHEARHEEAQRRNGAV